MNIRVNPIVFYVYINFVILKKKYLADRTNKKVQYGCQGKSWLFSDHSERTLYEIYSSCTLFSGGSLNSGQHYPF